MPPSAARASRARAILDRGLAPFTSTRDLLRPPHGWVYAIRTALGMTQEQLAARMDLNKATVRRLERSEADGRIQLDTLTRAADALGCELVYFLIPRRPLQDMVQSQAEHLARAQIAAVDHTMLLEDQVAGPQSVRVRALAADLLTSGAPLWRSAHTDEP